MTEPIVRQRKSRKLPMALKCIKWCKKNNIIDTTFFDTKTNTRYGWNYRTDEINFQRGEEFFRLFGYDNYKCMVDNLVEYEKANPNTIVGMTSEGYLNQTLLNDAHPRFKEKFINFLKRYNYKYKTIDNCYYILYQTCSENN